ncbi:hypothetical protein GLUCOINTEAF2_0204087 [Komagataeibacter intermedius AF2]|uniref:Uncharacterized protein n=1 Tax=Komagataeibacter intermedius AF2 TaxID=1458464 RepID=A0A0N1FQ98_9PROT|nr:hypothetical protein GLUCOINTEAF2_0204087 [Komagataeibacter intermedius AF2]
MAFPFSGTSLADGQQAAETAIGSPVHRVDQHWREIDEIETAAHDQADAGLFRGNMGLHHARQGIAVTYPERLNAKSFCLFEQFDRRRRPTQEREIRRHLKFGV